MRNVSDALRTVAREEEIGSAPGEPQKPVERGVAAAERKPFGNTVQRYQQPFAADPLAFDGLGAAINGRTLLEPLPARENPSDPDVKSIQRGTFSIEQNRRDPAVKSLQQGLMTVARSANEPAFALPRAGADGIFGPETRAAVKAFQSAHGLQADGVVGAKTLAKLNDLLAGSSHTSTAIAPNLGNARFRGDPLLERVGEGKASLGRGAAGEAVKRLQTTLIDVGFELPTHGADGRFGLETANALRAFQVGHGFSPTGVLDGSTLRMLDSVAPAPGVKAVMSPEYDQMLADGVLTTTLGVGFDEDGHDLRERRKVLDGLRARGFAPLEVKALSDAQLKAMGFDSAGVDKEGSYFWKQFELDGKPVKALVKYVDRYTTGHKDRFAEGFRADDLVLYGGHARYGSGPDFDAKSSTAGNFVLGVNGKGHRDGTLTPSYDAHMRQILKASPNDLERTGMTDDYQLMFFSGCTTSHYLDELRGIPKNKSRSNLDLIGSTEPLYWDDIGDNILSVLDGVMSGKSVNDLHSRLVQQNDGAGFTTDGFADNAYRP